jgi:biopolymer transport protein ExbD
MRRRSSAVEEEESSIDITPMLDVVFIMLIFFIVTASFVKESGLDANRPDDSTQQVVQEKANILVQIRADSSIWIDARKIDPRAVEPYIQKSYAENPEAKVIIQPSRQAKTEAIVTVMDAARAVGIDPTLTNLMD